MTPIQKPNRLQLQAMLIASWSSASLVMSVLPPKGTIVGCSELLDARARAAYDQTGQERGKSWARYRH